MIGYKQNAMQIVNAAKSDYLDNIKKVDIDIFNDGVSKNMLTQYTFIPSPSNSGSCPIRKLYSDDHNLLIQFAIDFDPEKDSILSLILDDEIVLNTQVVTIEDETYGFVICTPSEAGQHTLQLIMASKPSKTITYKFHILAKEIEKGSNVDVPQVSYRNALLNVVKLWLLSHRYDRVRHPNWAGFFDDRLQRFPMTDEGAKMVQEQLQAAVIEKIKDVVISEITAEPKLVDRSWDVGLTALDLQTKIITKAKGAVDTTNVMSTDAENVVKFKNISDDFV
mgnify:CR=1 FL=1